MCIIAIKKKGVKFPQVETIKTMCDNNPDGFAIVYHIKGQEVQCMRSLKSDDVYALYRKLLKHSYKKVSFFMHARIKTHGTININNCHGWHSDECNVYFAHNGILSIKNRDDMTDSETFLRDIFTPAYIMGGWPAAKLTIDACIGTSKFVFMNEEGEIAHFGNYIESDGMLYSNSTYKEERYSGYYQYSHLQHIKCPFKSGDMVECNKDYGLFKKGERYKITTLTEYGANAVSDDTPSISRYIYQDNYKNFTIVSFCAEEVNDAQVKIGDIYYIRKSYSLHQKGTKFVVKKIYKDESIALKPLDGKNNTSILFTLDELDDFFSKIPITEQWLDFDKDDILECMEEFCLPNGQLLKRGEIVVVYNVYNTGMSIETDGGYAWVNRDNCNKFLLLDY